MQKILLLILFIICVVIAPYFIYPILLMKWLCISILACSVNLLLGRAGLLSFGHAAFYGLGAYISGYSMLEWRLTPELALLIGMASSALLGAVFGGIAIRRKGIYFAMITLALAQMLYFIFLRAPFTGGEDGLQSIPRGKLFGIISLAHDMTLYWFIVGLSLLVFFFIWRVSKSPFGQAFKAIGEHENRALSLGISAKRLKHLAFIMSASLAGLAGAMKALVFQFASLGDAHWTLSGEAVLMTLLGGSESIFGPSIGAAIIVFIENGLAERAGASIGIILGLTFMMCTLVFRKGIAGALSKFKMSKF